jgi:hypothetical protein
MQIGINIFVSFLLQPKLKIFQKYFTRKIVTSAQKCQFKKTIGGFLGFFGRFFGQFFLLPTLAGTEEIFLLFKCYLGDKTSHEATAYLTCDNLFLIYQRLRFNILWRQATCH